MDFGNLLSGFLGVLVGVLLTPLFSRMDYSYKMNRIRNTIINYLSAIAIPKCEKYISQAHRIIDDFSEMQGVANIDLMPMLNSELIKSFSFSDLRQSLYYNKSFIDILDICYSIDYLVATTPADLHGEFVEFVEKHCNEKDIDTQLQILEHAKTCPTIIQTRDHYSISIKYRIERAEEMIIEMNEILTLLKGSNAKWIYKYFFAAN